MLKPVQRVPQYKMLLESYFKYLPEDGVDFDDTTDALKIVAGVAEHCNDSLHSGSNFERLLHLQSRLGNFELIKAGRELLKEGELEKLSRKSVAIRYLILLSDCLLYTYYSGAWVDDNTGLRVGYTIPIGDLRVRGPPPDHPFPTEFYITSSVNSFIIRARSTEEREEWVEAISSAQEDYFTRQMSFSPSQDQHHQPAQDRMERVSVELGEAAPVWVPDERVTRCQSCDDPFTFRVRRHHCRACGEVVCGQCSASKAPIKYKNFETVRVCPKCCEALKQKYYSNAELMSRFKIKHRATPRHVPARLIATASQEEAVRMSGLLKLRLRSGKWKQSWWVLKDHVLYRFEAMKNPSAEETIPVLGWTLETLSDKNFELYEGMSPGLVFQLSHPAMDVMVFCADNDNFAEKWTNALREATVLPSSDA